MEECFYCQKDQRLQDLMVEVCELNYSIVYLIRNQNFPGRCVVAYKEHRRELFDLNQEELAGYSNEVARVSKAIHQTFKADKINYGIYGDKVPHLHCHLVPKIEGQYCWGTPFNLQGNDQYLEHGELLERVNLIKKAIEGVV